jgi:outer membrane protein TolC
LIKPLYTFGKIENFAEAARGNIDIKQADVSIQRGKIILDVNRAYYGYLTARDTRKLLQDVLRRLQNAAELVEKWLADGSGDVKQSDKHALAAGRAIVKSYLSEARAIENIALDGLRVLTGVGLGNELEVADKRVKPVPLPEENLAIFQEKALQQRPEMTQVESGLRARRSLVLANEAGTKPNVYTGLAGRASYTPGRSRLDNPHALDVYNHAALSPMLGIKWDFTTGVQSAKVTQAQAELDAMVATAAFARAGIPFEVAEQYHQVVSHYERVKALEQGSRAGRRWMISSYADFEAGLEKADKVITAFQGYVLAHTQYLRTVNDYNLHVARLRFVAGDLK